MSVLSPFVNFKSSINDNVNKVGAVLLAPAYACILDSILVTNKTNGSIKVSVNIIRSSISFFLMENLTIAPNQSFDLLNQFSTTQGQSASVIYLHANDILFGQSNAISNFFSCVVSYRELTEIS